MSGSIQRRVLGVVGVVLAALVWWFVDQAPTATEEPGGGSSSQSEERGTDPESGLPWVSEEDLPPEAQETLELIDDGGPFRFDRDGVTFENREELLPDRPSGHYAEYTVETPGSEDRGARRIVTGEDDEFFWTEDHYASFARIDR